MNTDCSRRSFLKITPLLPVAAAGVLGLRPQIARANEPIKHIGVPFLKPALNVYSFNSKLNAGLKGESNGVTMFELLDFCAKQGLEGIDATGYYMPNWPNPPPDSYLYEFKRRAHDLGIGILGTGTHDTFITTDKAERTAAVAHIKQWVEVCSKLGGTVLRVFGDYLFRHKSWKTPIPNNSHAEVEAWVADDLRECAEYGKQHGIIIGVQNHGDFNGTADDFLRLLKLVGSEWCGPTLDTGYFTTPDPYVDIAQVAPYAVNWTVKQSVFDGGYGEVPIDLERIMRIVRASGYSGYLPIETLSSKGKTYDPFTFVPAYLKKLRAAVAATA
ncbi:MAG TPA: sugar phosphate isomerase/epimerase family protein [Opitutaceae bacterium]|nr:sugar phosphate isomerase/epimerase family protein [Opitutaceae bacterium]